MNSVSFYERLPETLNPDEMEKYVIELINPQTQFGGDIEQLAALSELSMRHLHNSVGLGVTLRQSVLQYVKSRWDLDSMESTELVVEIIFNFLLVEGYWMLRELLPSVTQKDVREELLASIEDLNKVMNINHNDKKR